MIEDCVVVLPMQFLLGGKGDEPLTELLLKLWSLTFSLTSVCRRTSFSAIMCVVVLPKFCALGGFWQCAARLFTPCSRCGAHRKTGLVLRKKEKRIQDLMKKIENKKPKAVKKKADDPATRRSARP